jgi:UDP-N-acetylglucosamine--N-acetylmuramyl-(pentapeptide) pyrophosphoryl-undecaprenol N-acetylglucosamine transferase
MPNVLEPGGASRGRKMIVAGGGTGGHLFPGIAVAQAFTARHHRNRVLFINAGRPFERDVLDRLGWPRETIPIEGIKGRGFLPQARALFKIPLAVWRAWTLIKAYAPDVVFGVGGYSAGPVVVAAWMQGVRTALHEQNQLPGLTNRLLRRIVDRNYLTFEDASGRFDARKTLVTGNPVRDEILALGGQPRPMEDAATFNVLIIGGSQGAQAINKAMVEALPMLKDCAGLKVVHQTGIVDEPFVAQAYAKAGIAAVVQAFFEDVADRYQRADLIVCRAGATTVAEITAIGRAALFVPFPFAADDHQTSNARALVEAGAAEMIAQPELSGEVLARKIKAFAQNRSQLTLMAAKARSLGRPEAALTIVNDLCMLADG